MKYVLLHEMVLYVSVRIHANTTLVLIHVIPDMKYMHMRVTTRHAIIYIMHEHVTIDMLF